MSGDRRSQGVATQPDILDSVFDWTERIFCSQNATQKNMPEQKEDVLDYVFEHVESFACQDEGAPEPRVLYVDQSVGLQRDNSLLETEQNGRPARLQTQRKIKPLGQEGDMIDYVFDHVQSLVCAEDIPERDLEKAPVATVTPPRQDMTYKAAKKRIENVYEQEDEIQLYFRPQRS